MITEAVVSQLYSGLQAIHPTCLYAFDAAHQRQIMGLGNLFFWIKDRREERPLRFYDLHRLVLTDYSEDIIIMVAKQTIREAIHLDELFAFHRRPDFVTLPRRVKNTIEEATLEKINNDAIFRNLLTSRIRNSIFPSKLEATAPTFILNDSDYLLAYCLRRLQLNARIEDERVTQFMNTFKTTKPDERCFEVLGNIPHIQLQQQDHSLCDYYFRLAAINDYTEAVANLMPVLSDINCTDSGGNTAFLWACANGHTHTVELLLQQQNLNPCQANNREETPFYMACKGNHVDIIELLKGSDKIPARHYNQCSTERRYTPLHSASRIGHLAVVKKLLEIENVERNPTDTHGSTPFLLACYKGYTDVVALLLQQPDVDPCKSNRYGQTPFYHACEQGHLNTVKCLLACHRLIADDFNRATPGGFSPLQAACKNKHTAIVEMLIEVPRISLNPRNREGMTPFMEACQQGYEDIVDLFLQKHASVINLLHTFDQQGRTAFFFACLNGYTRVIDRILACNTLTDIEINQPDFTGRTAFLIACRTGKTDVVDLLLRYNEIDPCLPDYSGKTPFYYACQLGHFDVVKCLLNSDRISQDHPQKPWRQGKTPLMAACGAGKEDVVRLLLLSRRAGARKRTISGQTALHFASKNGHTAVVHALLTCDSNINIRPWGSLPFFTSPNRLAATRGHQETAALLNRLCRDWQRRERRPIRFPRIN